MQIIGINGFKRAGKDTTYLAVRKALADKSVGRAGFADNLKIFAAKSFGFESTDEHLLSQVNDLKEYGTLIIDIHGPLTARKYLQNLGNTARQMFGEDFWVDQLLPLDFPLDRTRPHLDVLCITDVRYPNEAKRIKTLGGVVWEVIRPGVESDGHASEQPLPPELVDWQILNGSTYTNLQQEVYQAIYETLND